MAIYLDNQPAQLPGRTLGEVVGAATETLKPQGRIVVEVGVDGEVLSQAQLESQQAREVEGLDVSLVTSAPGSLARDALKQVAGRLDEAGEAQQKAAELLQQDEPAAAMTSLGTFVQVWQQAYQAVYQSALLLEVDLREVSVQGETGAELVQKLSHQLTSVRDLLQTRDTVALADSLAYEWPEMLARWRALIAVMLEKVRV